MRTLKKTLSEPFPSGWIPKPGDKVIVPSVIRSKKRGYTAVVEIVLGDIVRVRTPLFRWGRQEFMLADIRPKLKVQDDTVG